MSISQLDARTALIVIDLQKSISKIPTVHPFADVLAQSCRLVQAFRKHKLPVVLVNVVGRVPGRAEQSLGTGPIPPEETVLMPELDIQPQDYLISKKTWGAFSNSKLKEYLASERVTQVVICGVATTMGVESTARQASELGLNVTLAIDAMTDRSLEAHTNSIERIFPRLGETGSTQEIIEWLEKSERNVFRT
jgi:nicotinamidase-related amidase